MQEKRNNVFYRRKTANTGVVLNLGNFYEQKIVKIYLAKRKAPNISLHYAKATFDKNKHQKSNAKIVFTSVKRVALKLLNAKTGKRKSPIAIINKRK